MYSYGVISTGIRLSVGHQSTPAAKKRIELQTSGYKTVKENFIAIYGTKLVKNLMEFEVSSENNESSAGVEGDFYFSVKVILTE